ncbi:hypothetical protein [Nocardia blacklockiae]|uniref:hypothetical protein n=1 Tax=Nocardia blacklockiae TaxID=480036 RepID=UPI00189428FB|nr:hypothetical protein [Nocardia blacklockiae]MBF6170464.1 hypothetical protein [Nocardia blacklockiae]
MTRRVYGADYWSVPIERAAHPEPLVPGWTPGWLLLDLPTALLLAVFVGTGWLGYAQPGPAEVSGPSPAVVVPTEGALPAVPAH